MIKLTDRLQMIADKINKGEAMADIGSDHGFLPLSLWERGLSPRVIMCDISEPSLAKAKAAAAAFQYGDELEFRVGDGLKVIEEGEVDDIVIAGMGGILITEILAADPVKTASFSRFILQPRNKAGFLRYWLCKNGFKIISNDLVIEGKFICEIISAEHTGNASEACTTHSEEDPYWDLPGELLKTYPELTREYAEIKAAIEEKILRGLEQSFTASPEDIDKVIKRIGYFRNIADRK